MSDTEQTRGDVGRLLERSLALVTDMMAALLVAQGASPSEARKRAAEAVSEHASKQAGIGDSPKN